MSRKEEIRDKVIDFILFAERQGAGTIERTKSLAGQADELLSYLDSVGGCLKVERELPEILQRQGPHKEWLEKDLKRRLLSAGYVATMPLIDKEEK